MGGGRAVLAFDLGASSGRAVIGQLQPGGSGAEPRLTLQEVHRFPNLPVQVGGRMHWDILRLLHEIKHGIREAVRLGYEIESLAIDSWAVDFGLIGRDGELLGNPYHYRDPHTAEVFGQVCEEIGRERIFESTGIQFLSFNTLYQLAALRRSGSVALEQGDKLLMIPDLLRYFLTGEMAAEYTNATTTQMLNPVTGQWNEDMLRELDIPVSILLTPVQPGTRVGTLSPQVCAELGVPAIPVYTVGEHDTASAVVAVPAAQASFAYLSCGTWSLLGTELPEAVLSQQALEWNFTNEGGVSGTHRLLKNIMGLWLVQESKRAWDAAGRSFSFPELVAAAAEAEPFRSLIDPDDDSFLNPLSMPEAIQTYCVRTGQPVPQTEGEIIRCVLESLALKYRMVLERTEQLSGRTFDGLHMVGGGIHNELLCRFTASAIGRPVWAGPAEGSALGNIVVQYMALGYMADLPQARRIIGDSFPVRTYEPEEAGIWNTQYERFTALLGG